RSGADGVVDAAVRRAFAAASPSRFPARCADQHRSFCSGNYRTDLRMFYCAAARACCLRSSAAARISWSLRCGIPRNWNVVQLLVRLEGLRTKAVCGAIVLDLVAGNAGATGRHFRKPMFINAYASEAGLGNADPQRATALRVLASWFLGMDGRS